MRTLRTLGQLAVVVDGTVTPLRWDRPTGLLVHLACRGGPVARTEAAFLYRPDAPDADALAYLRKLVFRARAKPWADGFVAGDERLAWPVATDAAAFRAACAARDLDRALALYEGPFLDGRVLDDVPALAAWQELERAELHGLWRGALRDAAERDLAAHRPESAAALAATAIRDDPLDEDAVRLRMRALLAGGLRREAQRVFAAFRERLRDELDAEPLDTTRALADAARTDAEEGPGAREAGPQASPRVGDALPRSATPFVGRARERARIAEALRDDAAGPIVLVGLGGTGKTRLATEAARDAAASYGGGAAFVPLGALASPDAFGPSVAGALGADGDKDAIAAAAHRLRQRPTLLVLDEFEGVVAAAPELLRLLAEAPESRAIVTSRVPLGVRGERIVELSGLVVPDADAGGDAVEGAESVRLFVERARRVAPDFTPTRATLRTVARLCRRLDGLPLAIELLAAWTRTAPLDAIEEELARRPATVLTGADRDRPARHRDLWALFDAAWNDLEAGVRQVAVRLAAFPDAFAYEAARAVADAGLPSLLALLDRGLLRRDDDGRYRMHALVRTYLLERGDGAGRDAHAGWTADRLHELDPDLRGGNPVAALLRFDALRADVDAAWAYACERRDAERIERMRDPVDYALYYRSRFADGARLFARAADAFADGPPRLTARLQVHLAQYERNLGRVVAARRRAEAAYAALEEHGTPLDLGHAAYEIATAAHASGDPDRAEREFRTVLAIGRAQADAYLQGAAENGLGNLTAATRGDPAGAERHHRAALRAYSAIGHLEGIVGARINLGADRFDRGDLAGATESWERALSSVRELGSVQREAVLLANLAAAAEEAGRPGLAERRYRRSLALRARVGDRAGEATVLHALGRIAAERGRHDLAVRRLRRAADAFAELNDPGAHAHALATLARTLLAAGRTDDADRASAAALAEAHAHGAAPQRRVALLARAEVHRSAGRPLGAARLAAAVAADAAGAEATIRRQAERLVEELAAHGTSLPGGTEAVEDLDVLVREELASGAAPPPSDGGTSVERGAATVRHGS